MKRLIPIVLGLVAGGLNGLLGVGGTLLVPGLSHWLDLEQHKAHGTAIAIILPTSLISFFVYLMRTGVNLDIAWKVAAGGVLGGVIGAKLLRFIPARWLRTLFGVAMILVALRLVLAKS